MCFSPAAAAPPPQHTSAPNAGQGVVTVGDINPQDWNKAADEMIQSPLSRDDLTAEDSRRMVIMIGRIQNNILLHIDTDILTKKILTALNRSGKFVLTTAVGLDGPEDASTAAIRELRNAAEFDQSTLPQQGQMIAPDYSLGGKIIQQNIRADRARQATYTLQLALTDLRTGLAFWSDEREITKPGKRAAVSW